MTQSDDQNEREVLQLFADRLIDKDEAEERRGLHFSEILILMGKMGIKRKAAGITRGCRQTGKKRFLIKCLASNQAYLAYRDGRRTLDNLGIGGRVGCLVGQERHSGFDSGYDPI
ncbi:hypothetical protein SAMN05216227_101825 [Pseudorhodobacter antarcticus]|jgi:hypothetical protein|uniref:Uncharacterized protein n=1 Tax=Pseudorhodobacter antarcticus TaxID=1077947 RepID=A0A1H8HVB6_9RHOB|nr:hypothetical protein [Pseudorhodobacter antarcticus]SEN59981.1 hypothetical protein SAMN05216227_101825 [Pseudorhodobacter antarcticus]